MAEHIPQTSYGKFIVKSFPAAKMVGTPTPAHYIAATTVMLFCRMAARQHSLF